MRSPDPNAREGSSRQGDRSSRFDSDPFSSSVDESEPPLILAGEAESTNVSDGDLSSGTISEDAGVADAEHAEATIDLSSEAMEGAEHGPVDLSGPAVEDPPATASTEIVNRAPPYRPTRRPPMAVLRVYDDGSGACQELRVRKTPFDIGRLEGDLIIPHELQMSRRHLRIDRAPKQTDPATTERNLVDWTLTDLRSLNGTFLRRPRLAIRDRDEALLGGELVRFLLPEASDNLVLVKVGPGRSEEKVTVQPGSAWIGSDASQCLAFLVGNPFLDPQRLRLDCDRRGSWSLSDVGSTNGLWVRVESAKLQDGDEWQSGEQRFSFFLP